MVIQNCSGSKRDQLAIVINHYIKLSILQIKALSWIV